MKRQGGKARCHTHHVGQREPLRRALRHADGKVCGTAVTCNRMPVERKRQGKRGHAKIARRFAELPPGV